jgi:hypothetical protein
MRMYRVFVFSKTAGNEPHILYVTARNKREAISHAHKECDRRGWVNRWAIYPHDLVRVDPTTKEEVDL